MGTQKGSQVPSQDKEKADELPKLLDLDSRPNNQTVPNNILLSRNRQRGHQLDSLNQQRPHSVYNEYSNMVFVQKNTNQIVDDRQLLVRRIFI